MQLNTAQTASHRRHGGFTLVEMAIVLVLIGLILGGILNAQSIIRNGQTKDTIKAMNDLAAAAQQFQSRYGMLPGDFSNANASLPGMVGACAGAAGNGNGDGTLTAAESVCATQQLILAGMIKGTVGNVLTVRTSTLSVTGRAVLPAAILANVPANWVNVVLIQTTDCDVAVQMDRALDDGNTNTGNFRTATANCGAGGTDQIETTAVANAVLRLN